CLAKFQEKYFPRRRKLMKWILGDNIWIRGVIPKEIKELMPMPHNEDKKQFIGTYPEGYFGGSFDVIKANWWPEQPKIK
ncbi:MAG: hypothetical protein KGI29_02590, partial [Pseudomonadota bacterium]|nr:hypothetical protein [Pseudomonadota bacterium]